MSLTVTVGTADQVAASSGVASSTTSFSPAAGQMVRICAGWMDATDQLGKTFTCTDSHSNSYTATLAGGDADGGCYLLIFDHVYASAPGSTTVSITAAGTGATATADCLIQPYLISGQAADQGAAAHNSFSEVGTPTSTCEILLTTTQVGSAVFVLGAPNQASTTVTPISGTTTDHDWDDSGVGAQAVVGRGTTLTTTPGSTNFGWTLSPSSTFGYGVMASEVLPAWTAVGAAISPTVSGNTFTLVPSKVGDLILFAITATGTQASWATALASAGGNVTWSVLVSHALFPNNNVTQTVFIGKVVTASSHTVTITPNTGTPTWRIGGREFSSQEPFAQVALDSSGTIDVASAGICPSVTPSGLNGLYWSFLYDNGTAIAGSTTGYTYAVDGNGNMQVHRTDCPNSAQQPNIGDTGDGVSGIAVMLKQTQALTNNVTAAALLMSPVQLAGTVNNTVNVTAAALNMAPVQLAGTVNNPVNLNAGALLMSPVQLAGTVNNQGLANHLTAGALNMAPVQLAGTVNNPVNIGAGALLMSPVQLAGVIATQKNLTAGAFLMSPVQLAGTLSNPVNLSAGALNMSVVQLAGMVATQKNLTAGNLSLQVMQLRGLVGSGNESLTINGQNIMSCARAFTADLSGLLSAPAVRTADIAVPGRHGLVSVPRKLYDRAQIPMTIWVRGMNEDNTWPDASDRDTVFYKNLDTLIQMFAVPGTVTLAHLSPAGTTRLITGQVLQAFVPKRYAWSEQATGSLQVIIECANPFWRDPGPQASTVTAPTTAPVTQQLAEQDGSTAPVEDAVITFAGPCTNPRLACGNWFVQYSGALTGGQSVVIDVGAWTLAGTGGLVPGYASLVHAGLGPWLSIAPVPPGTGGPSVTYSITAGGPSVCTVAARRAYLGG